MKNVQKKTTQKVVKKAVKKVSMIKAKAPKVEAKPQTVEPKQTTDGLDPLKEAVEQAKVNMDKAKVEANELQQKAQELIKEAKHTYHEALLPYKEACKKAGVDCEYFTGRISNVSDRVVFLTEKVDNGIKVAIKGRPETEKVISAEALNKSLNLAAYSYTETTLGPKEEIGNKGGTLSNRLRKLWK